jgi:hypothetical protein
VLESAWALQEATTVPMTIDDEQRARYRVAVDAVAEWLSTRLAEGGANAEDYDAYLEHSLKELRRLESTGVSEHAWIFHDPITLLASDQLFDALDERPDGSRDWLHADLSSAVAAVARYDVMSAVVDRVVDWAEEGEAEDGAMQMGD